MSDLLTQHLTQWRSATAELPWGAQRVLHETLTAVAENGIHLVHGADYRDGKPCLINAAGSMLTSSGGAGIPMQHYGRVVRLFDQINSALQEKGVNDASGYVSPLAAEILLRHYAPLKSAPSTEPAVVVADATYVEPSDEALAAEWLTAMQAPAPSELYEPATDPVDGFNKDFIKSKVQHQIFSTPESNA